MTIDHIALWTKDLDKMKDFYSKHFDCKVSERYDNKLKQFSSYFLSFPIGSRIELMKRNDIIETIDVEKIGLAHFAICVGTPEKVDSMTKYLEESGVHISGYPRTTGDNYYESVILDPEGNKVEITASLDYEVKKAALVDLENILYLQKCCYLSEAELYNDYSISPLTQTLDSIKADFVKQTIYKLYYKGEIIGSIRAFVENDTCFIGRLVVDRKYQNMGFGKLLLETVERDFDYVKRFELFTGNLSSKNLSLYSKFGYKEFKVAHSNELVFKYLEKRTDL